MGSPLLPEVKPPIEVGPTVPQGPKGSSDFRMAIKVASTIAFSTLACFSVDRGCEWGGMQPNVINACLWWIGATICFGIVFWQWAKYRLMYKLLVVIGLPTILIAIFSPWMINQYKIQHAPAPPDFAADTYHAVTNIQQTLNGIGSGMTKSGKLCVFSIESITEASFGVPTSQVVLRQTSGDTVGLVKLRAEVLDSDARIKVLHVGTGRLADAASYSADKKYGEVSFWPDPDGSQIIVRLDIPGKVKLSSASLETNVFLTVR